MSIAWSIETHERVHSTQDIAKDLASRGQAEGLVIHALEQNAGRGRHGREWVSESGNLYLSMLLLPACHAQKLGQLSLLTGLALARAVLPFLEKSDVLQLKWPNDVLLDGRKCAGLLLETELNAAGDVEFCVVGIGLNLVSAPQDIWASVADYSAKVPQVNEMRDLFLAEFGALYSEWMLNGFDGIAKDWLVAAHRKGTPLKVKVGEHVEDGTFHAIDDAGNLLLLDRASELKVISAGEVYLFDDVVEA